MPSIGPLELIVVLIIALVVIGPKKLPGLGKSLGTGMREFKDSISGNSKDDDKPEITSSSDESATSEHDDTTSRPRG